MPLFYQTALALATFYIAVCILVDPYKVNFIINALPEQMKINFTTIHLLLTKPNSQSVKYI